MPEQQRGRSQHRPTGEHHHCCVGDRSSSAFPPSLRQAGLVWQLLCSLLFVASILAAAPMASVFSERTRAKAAHTLKRYDAALSSSESEIYHHHRESSSGSVLLPTTTPLVALSPLLLMAPSHNPWSRDALLSVVLQPLVLELGAVVLCQAVGLPLLSKLGVVLRRVRIPSSHLFLKGAAALRRVPIARTVARHLKVMSVHSGRVWKAFGHVYKQTSLSKIVNRSKKILKVFVHHEDDHHHREEDDKSLKAH